MTCNVTDGALQFGIGVATSSSDNYIYADDFTVTRVGDVKEDTGDDDDDSGEGTDTQETADYTDEQGIKYILWLGSKTASVHDGKSCEGEVTVPATITVDDEKYTVNSIESSAFSENSSLTAITVGKNVYGIWGSAFSNCYNLMKVYFEEGSCLANIDTWAFYGTGIDSLDVPKGVTEITEGSFSNCWNLTYVNLKGEITKIGDWAFSKWADGGTERNWSPFNDGVWIWSVEPPEISTLAFNQEDIAEKTLYVHYSLTENEVYTSLGFANILPLDTEDTNLYYVDEQGVRYVLWEDGTAGVVGYDNDHAPGNVTDWQITIPDELTYEDQAYSVTYIVESAFSGHYTLSAVTFPESLTSIGKYAFYGTAIKDIVVGEGVTEIWEGTFGNCWNLQTAEFYGELTHIDDFAFSTWAEEGCATTWANIQSVTLWNSASAPTISDKAFYSGDIVSSILYVDESLVDDATYNALGFAHVYPIGFDAIKSARTDKAADSIYRIDGTSVRKAERPGLYIVNGKKYILR